MKMSKRIQKLRKILRQKRAVNAKKPKFRRPESWRYKRLETGWRRPKGIDSKIRQRERGQPAMPTIGYRSPVKLRHLHPSGLKEVLVHTPDDLEGLQPKVHAVRIGHRVGGRKRVTIMERAEDKGLHVLNPQLRTRLPSVYDITSEELS